MSHILRTPEGKKVRVDARYDESLYDAPHNPPNTGTAYTSGTDLFRHVARSGKAYYYTYSWSMWQGAEPSYNLLTEEETREFLLKRAEMSGHMEMGQDEIRRAEEIFPGIFDEDA